jgi:hypothetical protein
MLSATSIEPDLATLSPQQREERVAKQQRARSKASTAGLIFEETWAEEETEEAVVAIRQRDPEVFDEYLFLQLQAFSLPRASYVTVERFRQPIWERVSLTEISESGDTRIFTPLLVNKQKWTFASDTHPLRLCIWTRNADREPTISSQWEGDLLSLYAALQHKQLLPFYSPSLAPRKRIPKNALATAHPRGLDLYYNVSSAVLSSTQARGHLFSGVQSRCLVRLQFECLNKRTCTSSKYYI